MSTADGSLTDAQPLVPSVLDAARSALASAPTRTRTPSTPGRIRMRHYRLLVIAVDIAMVGLALGVATIVRFGVADAALPLLGHQADYGIVAAVIGVLWLTALAAYRSRDIRFVAGTAEYRRVITATVTTFGIVAIAMYLLKVDLARGLVVIALPMGLALLLIGRRGLRGWLESRRRHGDFTMSALVVGPAADVRRVISALGPSTGSAYSIAGVALDKPRKTGETITVGRTTVPVLGSTRGDVAALARAYRVDTVVIAGQPRGGSEVIRDLGWALERTDADLMIASRLVNVAGPRIQFRPADGLPLMHVELPIYAGGKHLAKRLFDIVMSGGMLLALSPLFLALAVLVRLDSPGSAFFSQQRVGRNGVPFRMWKFRSMVATAERDLAALQAQSDGNGVLFKMKSDPRVTRVGKVLRRYSLDELPQLWNVLMGDMSLVGPRPPLGSEVQNYEDHVLRRLYVKPGLTGMWQISGRSDLSWEESVRLDLYYVENWSITGDLLLLWRTVKVVVRGTGAY